MKALSSQAWKIYGMESEGVGPKSTHNLCRICSAISLTELRLLLLPWADTRGPERRVPAVDAILAMREGERDRWHALRERGMAYMDTFQIRLFLFSSFIFSASEFLPNTFFRGGERKLIAQRGSENLLHRL